MSLSLLPCPLKQWDPAPSPITFSQPTTTLNALTNFAAKKVNQHKCEPSSHLVKQSKGAPHLLVKRRPIICKDLMPLQEI